MPHICVQSDFINPYRIQSNKAGLFQKNVSERRLGYLFTGDSLDRQVDHRIYRLIWVAVNFWGGEGWVSACHHCRIVPDDEDPKFLAKVTHHLVLVLAKVPRQVANCLPNLVMVCRPTLCQPQKCN